MALPSCWALHCGCGVSMPPSRKGHVCTGVWSGWVSCWDWGYQLWGLARGEEADVRTATLGWGNILDEQKSGSFRGLNRFRNQCRDSCLLHWFSGSVAPSSHWAPWMGCVFFSLVVVAVWSLSCVWLFGDPMDGSPPGSSGHVFPQARILEWAAIPNPGIEPESLHWEADSLLLSQQGSSYWNSEAPIWNPHVGLSNFQHCRRRRATGSCVAMELSQRGTASQLDGLEARGSWPLQSCSMWYSPSASSLLSLFPALETEKSLCWDGRTIRS